MRLHANEFVVFFVVDCCCFFCKRKKTITRETKATNPVPGGCDGGDGLVEGEERLGSEDSHSDRVKWS